ncbi:Cysteine-rich RLK (RECEPTOR-like protein kinase) 8, putative [Theobroma cacao]|uniref:Cysteine-rich RLK (RECEPTOR-like protein kinase) 8, putative n=1 Tax=Theobroma cacao TaxID=3641 RepID=A0A061E5N7_THECC|nr:Cysteine-rich RLK (RECEPTOR-like protein kinase) 8, putative [Theobroma cacao]
MIAELKALEDNGTWSIVPLPSNCHAVGCKWVYKVKLHANGSIERYKARLVAKGYNQVEGFDYQETFSPIAKQTTVKVFFALTAAYNWHLSHHDVNNAFLDGDLAEEVYMEIPQGYSIKGEYPNSSSKMVCRLHKSLYGLKQASRQWNAKLTASIVKYGFKQSTSDYSLFTMRTINGDFVALLVHVDDIFIASNSTQTEFDVKNFLSSQFKLKDLGKVKYFLGLEVARSPEGISICQRKYTLDLLEEYGLLGPKPVSTPIDYNHRLSKVSEGNELVDATSYRQLVGKLLVLKYLKKAPGQGILMKSKNNLKISGYSNSDWAGCLDTRKSITGYCIFIGDSLVSWKSKKQSVVARSSAEAEYRAMATTCCEIIWLKYLMSDFGINDSEAINLYSDSQSAIHISRNPVHHERTKHIEMDCHFIREKVLTGVIKPLHISTDSQLSDIFTKALQPRQFYKLLGKMNVHNIHCPS